MTSSAGIIHRQAQELELDQMHVGVVASRSRCTPRISGEDENSCCSWERLTCSGSEAIHAPSSKGLDAWGKILHSSRDWTGADDQRTPACRFENERWLHSPRVEVEARTNHVSSVTRTLMRLRTSSLQELAQLGHARGMQSCVRRPLSKIYEFTRSATS